MFPQDFRERARDSLAGSWPLSILVCLVAGLLGGAIGGGGLDLDIQIDQEFIEQYPQYAQFFQTLFNLAIVSSAISLIFGGTVSLGHCTYLLNQYDRTPKGFGDLFSQFHQFTNGFCLALFEGIYIFLWSLLFVIPGIVAAYKYAMAPFIQAEHPDYTASECITMSKELMDGHKLDLFFLDLSFIGWSLLSLLTLGIGSLFVAPYKAASYAAFYRHLVPKNNIYDNE